MPNAARKLRTIRSGVVVNTVPGTPPRVYLLDILALEEFHHEHQTSPSRPVGTPRARLPFAVELVFV